MFLLDVALSHTHKSETEENMYFKMGIFIALGIALHNIPEGLAIGASNYISQETGFYTCHWYRFTQYCGGIMHSFTTGSM